MKMNKYNKISITIIIIKAIKYIVPQEPAYKTVIRVYSGKSGGN